MGAVQELESAKVQARPLYLPTPVKLPHDRQSFGKVRLVTGMVQDLEHSLSGPSARAPYLVVYHL